MWTGGTRDPTLRPDDQQYFGQPEPVWRVRVGHAKPRPAGMRSRRYAKVFRL